MIAVKTALLKGGGFLHTFVEKSSGDPGPFRKPWSTDAAQCYYVNGLAPPEYCVPLQIRVGKANQLTVLSLSETVRND